MNAHIYPLHYSPSLGRTHARNVSTFLCQSEFLLSEFPGIWCSMNLQWWNCRETDREREGARGKKQWNPFRSSLINRTNNKRIMKKENIARIHLRIDARRSNGIRSSWADPMLSHVPEPYSCAVLHVSISYSLSPPKTRFIRITLASITCHEFAVLFLDAIASVCPHRLPTAANVQKMEIVFWAFKIDSKSCRPKQKCRLFGFYAEIRECQLAQTYATQTTWHKRLRFCSERGKTQQQQQQRQTRSKCRRDTGFRNRIFSLLGFCSSHFILLQIATKESDSI